jgi:hypothetical protein
MRIALLGFLLAGALHAAVAQPELSVPVTVSNGVDSTVRFFGFQYAGNFCFPVGDTIHGFAGTLTLPPPVPGVFDARFICPVSRIEVCACFDLGQVSDFRRYRESTQRDTFKLRAQRGLGSSLVVSWPGGLASRFQWAVLRFVGSSGAVNVDMLTQTLVDITDAGDPATVTIVTIGPSLTAVRIHQETPVSSLLLQGYPNPFNPSTAISYEIGSATRVVLKVFDVLGREVATLIDGDEAPGQKSVRWDAGDIAGGVYFCRLQAGGSVVTMRMILLR